ncbi:helix-turn-helix transcriptional regulator [uncultured Bacteroides sp.]|uniref:helix-turn-helix domain-containing protein n=1 Tax=uncultured Bacteroides sp. TaxID=162156 RepID=UPI002AA90149|nr:helix-turn-helix transcriptional regulator [uncultured Bacteroides sp.]
MIAENIRLLREKFGYTQTQVASYLNITSSAVNQYESKARSIPADVVSKLAILFNVEEYDLYEENPQQQSLISAFAFRADELKEEDLKSIAAFRKIITNHFHLSNALENE